MRIPFDSLTLRAVLTELKEFEGAKAQKVWQPDSQSLAIQLYHRGSEGVFYLTAHPEYARAHFITKRVRSAETAFGMLQALRARLSGATFVRAEQVGFDRILHLRFEGPEGEHLLIAELMGRHSNLVFVDSGGKVLAATKVTPASKSKRPVVLGRTYEPPPFEPRKSILEAKQGDDLSQCEGASPLLLKLVDKIGLPQVQRLEFAPTLYYDQGAYPLDLGPLGLHGLPRSSLSVALENHFDVAIPKALMEAQRASLRTQLERVVLAREVAIGDLDEALRTAANAGALQQWGELILAYQGSVRPGGAELDAWDYEGAPIQIRLNPELSALENANRYFDKAKRAKGRASWVAEHREVLETELGEVQALLERLSSAGTLEEVQSLNDEARGRRWLHSQPVTSARKEARPFDGHRVRELVGPGGFAVLYGENSEANDYLTLRVARPNDWWLHVRGGVSAHVVIRTQNQPQRVQKETLLFAAKVCVQNSPQKHASLVAVDYTLKKYVRKPRGSAVGTVLYVQEKTLHVEA